VLKIADYDGDGLYDFGIYRPSTRQVIFSRSTNSVMTAIDFGSPTADYLVRGDFSGDGKSDIAFWEPLTAVFHTLSSDSDFSISSDLQLGVYNVHLPLSYNLRGGEDVFTVVDHQRGLRYWRDDNLPDGTIESLQWGLPGDFQG